ncbi:MAG: hypothetical protein JSV70_07850 [bacterium]|nr:MAG: hypothetical protein JSV70_07850 [bacterium]
MKTIRALITTAAMILLTVHQAYAVDTTQTYQSGMLVLLFLGVCALIVVAQMVPALILMMGTISALAKKLRRKERAAVTNTGQEIID